MRIKLSSIKNVSIGEGYTKWKHLLIMCFFLDGLLKSTKKIVETKRRDVYNDTEIFSSSSGEESDDFRNPMFPSL